MNDCTVEEKKVNKQTNKKVEVKTIKAHANKNKNSNFYL